MRRLIALLTVSVMLFSSCSLFKKQPQEAVNEGIKELALVKRGQSHTIVKGTIQGPTGEAVQKMLVNLDLSGYSDTSDMESPLIDITLKGDVTLDGQKGSAEVQVRSVNKMLYFKLNALALPGEDNEMIKAQVQSLTGNWWYIPLNDSPLKQLTDNQKELNEKFKTLEFFSNAQEDGVEDVQGVDSTRYRVEINKDSVKEFILTMARQEGNVVSSDEEKAIGDSLKDLDFSGAVSVGDDDVAHRIKGTLSMQPDQGALSSFDIDYQGWDFDSKQSVEVPEGAKEFSSYALLPLIGALSVSQGALGEMPTAPTAAATGTTPVAPAAGKVTAPAAGGVQIVPPATKK